MVTICILGEGYEEFWNPLMLKYADRPNVAKFIRGHIATEGNAFVTPDYAIPTYETMIALEQGKHLEPRWHGKDGWPDAKTISDKEKDRTTTMYDARDYV